MNCPISSWFIGYNRSKQCTDLYKLCASVRVRIAFPLALGKWHLSCT